MPPALTVDLAARAGFDWHAHDHHQLALAAHGIILMAAADTTWVLPRSRALWIPAGIRHSVAADGETTMVSLYVEPARCPLAWTAPTVVDAGGLLGDLVIHLADDALPDDERERAEAVLWDLMVPLPVSVLSNPMPGDDRARQVAEGLLADVTDDRSLAEWGRAVGASSRTLARLFVAETGIGFGRWRTNARLGTALGMLAAGAGVGAVARRVGYTTPSAFVAAFRREVGTTPAAYFRSQDRPTWGERRSPRMAASKRMLNAS